MLKTLLFSAMLAVGLSSPSLAQTPAKPANATPAPASKTVAADTASPDEALIAEATTPEDRARLMLRCAGPPPRPVASAAPSKEPTAEPAVAVERASGSHGG